MTSSSSSIAEPRGARRFDGLLTTPSGGGFSALGAGLLPDRELSLDAVARLHRLLVPEMLTAAPDIPTRRRRICEEVSAIEPLLAEQVLLALAFQDRVEARERSELERRARSREVARGIIDRLPELRQRLFHVLGTRMRGPSELSRKPRTLMMPPTKKRSVMGTLVGSELVMSPISPLNLKTMGPQIG